MTRDEHLAWAKQRALEYVDRNELGDAVASMASDLRKHPELGVNDFLVAAGVIHVMNYDAREVRRWVEGFR